jgi:hypothetical protein
MLRAGQAADVIVIFGHGSVASLAHAASNLPRCAPPYTLRVSEISRIGIGLAISPLPTLLCMPRIV